MAIYISYNVASYLTNVTLQRLWVLSSTYMDDVDEQKRMEEERERETRQKIISL